MGKSAYDPAVTLPHLTMKLYPWQRKFLDSRNKMNFLTAANQVGKSSVAIIKNILWATEVDAWPELFKGKPKQFWYLYPDWQTINTEFREKWETFYLPKGKAREEGKYSWDVIKDPLSPQVKGIHFKKSNVDIWFRVYSQKKSAMQSSTVHMVTFDEELPVSYMPELQSRLNFTDGYFNGVFTATLSQEFWMLVMEGKGDRERLPSAHKQIVSLYDCMFYEDQTPSENWTEERIEKIKESCVSEAEINRRVYGRFVPEDALKYSAFDANKHFIPPFPVPDNYSRYCAVDPGSGGHKNHPASIAFIAVNPEHTVGYVYKGWRGDNVETTASDIMDQFLKMRAGERLVHQAYDFSARDFGIIANRIGEPFSKAEKSNQLGEETINTLFRNMALFIFDLPELQSLGTELSTLRSSAKKTNAKDDFIDAVRYATVQVPWDWEAIISKNLISSEAKKKVKLPSEMSQQEYLEWEIKQRRGDTDAEKSNAQSWGEFDDECEFWNDQYGS